MEITHDFHIHTNISTCADQTVTLDDYILWARKIRLKKIGIANHFWDEKIEGAYNFYRPQGFEHVSKGLPEIREKSNSDLKIYFGCEAEYDYKRREVSITEEVAEKFDYIHVPISHTHITMPEEFYMPYQQHVDYMIQAYEDVLNSKIRKYITAVAHPFMVVGCPYDNEILLKLISDDTFKRLFTKSAEENIACEINVWWAEKKTKEDIMNHDFIRMYRMAKKCGCKFIFGSDAHNNVEHGAYGNAQFIADFLELKESDIVELAK